MYASSFPIDADKGLDDVLRTSTCELRCPVREWNAWENMHMKASMGCCKFF